MKPLHFLQDRLGFTRHESTALLFLCVTLLIGHGVRWARHAMFPPQDDFRQFDYSALDSEFTARASLHLPDSLDRAGGKSGPAATGHADSLLRNPVNINAAGEMELCTLPGIGPALAHRIIVDRHAHGKYRSVEDLVRVKGIGRKKLEHLRRFVVLR